MRTKFVAGNWKMNMDKAGAVALAKNLVAELKGVDNKFMIAPPFVYLDSVAQIVKGSNIILGAQDIAATENGAHTGECSAAMLKDLGVDVVIPGHSERRYEFYETDKLINQKVLKALEHGLDVVLCIGELYSHKVLGVTEAVCELQIRGGLAGLTEEQLSHVVIAYEPIWAIGTGVTPTPEEANAIHISLRAAIAKLFGTNVADNMKILYGGSMNAANGKDFLAQSDIDGGLIGGASLKSETFVPICKYTV